MAHRRGTWPRRIVEIGFSGRSRRLSDERLQNGIILHRLQRGSAEGLDVEGDRGTDIRKRGLVALALADNRTPGKPERVGNVTVGVPFNDDFQWRHHSRMDPTPSLGKRGE